MAFRTERVEVGRSVCGKDCPGQEANGVGMSFHHQVTSVVIDF